MGWWPKGREMWYMTGQLLPVSIIFGSAGIGFGQVADTHGTRAAGKDAAKAGFGMKGIGTSTVVAGDGSAGIGNIYC